MNSKAGVFVKNSFWIYLGKIVTQLISVLSTILVIRKIDVEVFGVYNLLLIFSVVANIVIIGPINQTIYRYVPELDQADDKPKLKRLLLISFLFLGALLTVVISAGALFRNELFGFLGVNEFRSFQLVLVVFIITSSLQSAGKSITSSLLLHKKMAFMSVISVLVKAGLLIAFLPVMNVYYLLLVESIVCSLYVLIILFIVFKYFTTPRNIPDDQKISHTINKRRVMRYAILSSLNEIGAGIINRTSDYFIISSLASQYYTGLYAFAYKIYDYLYKIIPINELLSVLRPVFIQRFTVNYKREEFVSIYNLIVKMMLPISLFPAIYFIVFGKQVINYVFDPKYAEAYLLTCIVLLSNITQAFFYPLGISMQLKERMGVMLSSKFIAVLSIIGGIYAMKQWGIVGVASVTVFCDLLKNIYILIIVRKSEDIEYRLVEYINFLYVSAIVGGLFALWTRYFDNIIWLAAGSVLFALVTVLTFINLHPFTKNDLEILNKLTGTHRLFTKISGFIGKLSIMRSPVHVGKYE